MERFLILCDGANPPSDENLNKTTRLEIKQGQNLRLEIKNLSHALLKILSPLTRDLLDVASYIYHADGSISRGTDKDVMDESWSRELKFVIPVRQPETWNRPSVVKTLTDLLEFLTEHKFEFEFIEKKPQVEQLAITGFNQASPYYDRADCVLLFSGGMDSLAGAIQLREAGRKPILASHRSNPVIAKRQKRLAQQLRELPGETPWSFPAIDLFINRIGTEAIEDTQRSRSFLFLAIASVIAYELEINELVLGENGITSFNLPRIAQPLGTQASRTTHPAVIHYFKQLFSDLFEKTITISLPFIWMTRAEVLEIIKKNRVSDLLQLTVSCAHSRMRKNNPHCGVCSQCVDRRIAFSFADLDDENELLSYEKDMFTSELADGIEFMQVASPFQFLARIEKMDDFAFQQAYGQIFDAVSFLPGDPDDVLRKIFELHQRYAREASIVSGKEYSKNLGKIGRRELPSSCLLLRLPFYEKPTDQDIIIKRATQLEHELTTCPTSKFKPYEEICKKIINFLFCEFVPADYGLDTPEVQAPNDSGFKRRDIICRNHAKAGFWFEAKQLYRAQYIVFDAKNYISEIDQGQVNEIVKYLNPNGLGMFGVIIGRKLPDGAKKITSGDKILPSAVNAQKDQLRENKMIVLFDDEDLITMLKMKMAGKDPTDLVDERVGLLQRRL